MKNAWIHPFTNNNFCKQAILKFVEYLITDFWIKLYGQSDD